MEDFIHAVTSKLNPELLFKNLGLILAAYKAVSDAKDPSSRDALMLEFQGRLDAVANGRAL